MMNSLLLGWVYQVWCLCWSDIRVNSVAYTAKAVIFQHSFVFVSISCPFVLLYQLCLLFESYPVTNADRMLQTYIFITPFKVSLLAKSRNCHYFEVCVRASLYCIYYIFCTTSSLNSVFNQCDKLVRPKSFHQIMRPTATFVEPRAAIWKHCD